MLATCESDVSLSAVDQYMREVRAVCPIAGDEEQRLLEHLRSDSANAGGAPARLVEGYQPLVVCLAKRYAWRCDHLTFLDLVQEGNVGLLEAIDRYDGQASGVTFRSWAFSWVRGRMLQAIWRCERLIRLPVGKINLLRRLVAVQRSLLAQHGRESTLDELVMAMGIPCRDVLELLVLQAQQVVSIHSFPVDSAGGGIPPEEVVLGPSMDEVLEDCNPDRLTWLREAVERLPERMRMIIRLRYGLTDGVERTHREVAEILGLAQSAVEDLDRRVRIRLCRSLARDNSYGRDEAA